jgi:hypothetical protein
MEKNQLGITPSYDLSPPKNFLAKRKFFLNKGNSGKIFINYVFVSEKNFFKFLGTKKENKGKNFLAEKGQKVFR